MKDNFKTLFVAALLLTALLCNSGIKMFVSERDDGGGGTESGTTSSNTEFALVEATYAAMELAAL